MRRPFLIALMLLLAGLLHSAEYVVDHIIVRYIDAVSTETRIDLEERYGLSLIRQSRAVRNTYLYRTSGTESIPELADQLSHESIVEYACPDYVRQNMAIPTDPLFDEQWYMRATTTGSNGFSVRRFVGINYLQAMAFYSPPDSHADVIVAVLDSGTALFHPDLLSNIYINPNEIPDDKIDNDGNGLIDDCVGWDFVDGDNDPSDEHGHGTQVAGIIAGVWNEEGITGIAPEAKILPLRVLDQFGVGVSDSLIELAVFYALDMGARVVNGSFGGGPYSQYQQDIFDAMQDEDILFVFAAGNGGPDSIGDNNDSVGVYPASYDGNNILSVANVGQDGELEPSSNFGPETVDLGAPGEGILSTTINRAEVYAEGFEGNTSGWSQVSNSYFEWTFVQDNLKNTWATDSLWNNGYPADYTANTDSSLYSPQISLGGFVKPLLRVRVYLELGYNIPTKPGDYLWIEAAGDSGIFEPLLPISGFSSSWPVGTIHEVDLRDYAGQNIELRFRLTTDDVNHGDGVYIDDIEITGLNTLEYEGDEYGVNSGTSMAAPVVSGVAALVMSHRPDLTAQEVRQIILDTVQPLESLDYITVSGGMVEAAAAVFQASLENYRPLAVNDEIKVTLGSTVDVNLLGNDSDEDGDEISLVQLPESELGYFTEGEAGLAFTPTRVGSETSLYTITDGEKESTGEIFITVAELQTYQVSIAETVGGAIEIDPVKETYLKGSPLTATAIPDEGFYFNSWLSGVEEYTNPANVIINSDLVIDAMFSPIMVTANLDSRGRGEITASEEMPSVPYGTQVSFLFTPYRGFEFRAWSGTVDSEENPITLTLTDNVDLVPEVNPLHEVSLNLVEGPGYSISVEPEHPHYYPGETVMVSISVEDGFGFEKWEEPSGAVGTTVEYTIPEVEVGEEVTFSPIVKAIPHTVSLLVGQGGSASKDPLAESYLHGSPVVLSATPDRGYAFSRWIGDVESSENPFEVTVISDITIEAVFEELPRFTLGALSGLGYGLSVEPVESFYLPGETVTIIANLEEGFSMVAWSIPEEEEGMVIEYTFPGIEENEVITFAPVVAKEDPPSNLWADFETFGDWQSGWLGWITSVTPDYFLHLNLGTVYYVGESQESVWLYIYADNIGWVWVGKMLYPYLYSWDREWLLHLENSPWLNDISSGEWFEVTP